MGELGSCLVCGRDAVHLYPLLSGEPAFCSEHDNLDPDEHDHDDFDIPIHGEPVFGEVESLWIDKDGNRYLDEDDIKDDHLVNIVRLLRRKEQEAREADQGVRAFALLCKLQEMEVYAKQRGLEV